MRVSVINPRTGEALDWESPAEEVSLTRALSLASVIKVKYPAWYNSRTDENGHPWILKRGTVLVVEEDNGRLTPALIDDDSLAEDLEVSALGLSTLARDAPWEQAPEAWRGYDALRAWRFIWGRILPTTGVPRMTVTGSTDAGVLVGKDGTAAWKANQGRLEAADKFLKQRDNKVAYWEKILNNRARDMARMGGRKAIGEVREGTGAPAVDTGSTNAMYIRREDTVITAVYYWDWAGFGTGRWDKKESTGVKNAAREWIKVKASRDRAESDFKLYATRKSEIEAWQKDHASEAPEPYELNWWSTRDLAKNLEEIRELGGFEWYETAEWDDQDRLVPAIHATTSAGKDLPYLFELGVNINEPPEMHRGDVATHVTAMGAGEGQSTLVADRAWSHPRLVRKSRTVPEKDLGTRQLVDRAADRELRKARAALDWQFSNLVIADTPAAPLDQIDLGDTFTLTGTLSDGSDIQQRLRIREITRTWAGNRAGNTISIEVEPA